MKMSKKKITREAEKVMEEHIDILIYYMVHFKKEGFDYAEIAKIFSDTFKKTVENVAKEMQKSDEEEGI